MMSRYIVLILRMTAYCYHYLVCLQRMGYFGEMTRSSALQLDEAGLEVGELLYCTALYFTVQVPPRRAAPLLRCHRLPLGQQADAGGVG